MGRLDVVQMEKFVRDRVGVHRIIRHHHHHQRRRRIMLHLHMVSFVCITIWFHRCTKENFERKKKKSFYDYFHIHDNLHDTCGSPYSNSWTRNNPGFGSQHELEPELGSGSIILRPLDYQPVYFNREFLIYVYLPIL